MILWLRWQEVIPTFDMAVNELFFERFPDSILEYQIQVRPYNALKTRNMRSLNPEGVRVDSRARPTCEVTLHQCLTSSSSSSSSSQTSIS